MAYFAPYIDETGYHMPSYNDIRDELISKAKQIFGQDIYLGNDSQDYQFISAFASMLYDSYLTCQAVYNSRGPATAIGTGLDVVVGVNGIKRLQDTYSKAPVWLTGTPGTLIQNGIVSDKAGNNWSLPASVTIGVDGTYETTATCQVPGPIQAEAGTITGIVTPTLGWTSVTNHEPALAGRNTEQDPQLRARQAISTANPSRTVLEGIKGAIAAVSGVTRHEVYENDTGEVNELGHPPHSITAVVEGGDDQEIAETIAKHKTPGCYTNGTTTRDVTDIYGEPTPIRFFRPAYVDISAVVQVKRLSGFTTQTADDIASYVADYINSLAFGNTSLVISSLWGAALQANRVLTSPSFSIVGLTAARQGEKQSTADIPLAFDEAARGSKENVTVNVVG
ncbi:baseplate J/gp47 family protein [Brevibacillus ruminantium]|uniref:Baseplate J/gp47 family protein n=1 Tax=Brevibacillus ruminantium TaxID=2950604 RepID=A0ABY4WG99_9BACL|nr:baseplate J/gp47 family protein [Brevibacillus ruminantium]USG65153.1 baseplate J/gp47 family protein [Brevibacillus ruminantium]